jgi:hypothetical protein
MQQFLAKCWGADPTIQHVLSFPDRRITTIAFPGASQYDIMLDFRRYEAQSPSRTESLAAEDLMLPTPKFRTRYTAVEADRFACRCPA